MVICFKTPAKLRINLGIAKQGLQNNAKSFTFLIYGVKLR